MRRKSEEEKIPWIDDIYEANRLIQILHADGWAQYAGKRFWIWAFVFAPVLHEIFSEFLRGIWKGLAG